MPCQSSAAGSPLSYKLLLAARKVLSFHCHKRTDTDMKHFFECRQFVLVALILGFGAAFSTAIAQPISLVHKSTWPGFTRGGAHGVAVRGNFAFVAASQGGLMVMDVSNPSSPRFVTAVPYLGWTVHVKLAGDYAYVTSLYGVSIVDISDPLHPEFVSSMNYDGRSIGVDVVGSFAYVADEYNGLRIYDVSMPSFPMLVGSMTNPVPASAVQVVGNYAYVAATTNGLKIIDISNPANPFLVGGSVSPQYSYPYDVYVRSNYVFLSDIAYGLHIFNATNPASPVRIGGIFGPNAIGIDVAGNHLFLCTRIDGVKIINIANLAQTAPFVAAIYDTPWDALDVFIKDGLAYIADNDTGLQIADVRIPTSPTRVGELITGGMTMEVQVVGTNAVLAECFLGVRVVDVSNSTNPVGRGLVPVFGAIALQAVSNRIYVACQGDGLHIIDVSNPNAPVRLGKTATVDSALDVHTIGNIAYVADCMAGIQIYDVSNPAVPRRLGGALYTNDNVNATGIQVVGRYAYLSYATSGLRIFDVNNPSNVVYVSGYKNGGTALAVAVEDKYAYVANGYPGLLIVDVSDVANPQPVATFPVAGAAFDIQVVNRRAYIASEYGGITVVDVRNPRQPRLATSHTSGIGYGVCVSGEHVYLASGDEGLRIFRQVSPPRLWTRPAQGGVAIGWDLDPDAKRFTLEAAEDMNADWWQTLGTNNPTILPSSSACKFFRLRSLN
jgi:hypothetical protein